MTFAYGTVDTGTSLTVAVRTDEHVFDVGRWTREDEGLPIPIREALGPGDLHALLAAGRPVWEHSHALISDAIARGNLAVLDTYTEQLPVPIPDFVDFYASLAHVLNAGRILRPSAPQAPDAWFHIPLGYQSRAGSIMVSGTNVVRPCGMVRTDNPDTFEATFKPSSKLDLEAELGFIVGVPSDGELVCSDAFADHVFGTCVVIDWSARDIQAMEQRPLGPFLSKSFATTMSPWITPLDSLQDARVKPRSASRPVASHLEDTDGWGLDIRLEVEINGQVVSRPPYSEMFWSPAQMLAHMTSNGAAVRTGDLFASGTVSGDQPGTEGCLLELTRDGTKPAPHGTVQGYLNNGDTVVIRATAHTDEGELALQPATAVVTPSRPPKVPARA